MRIFGWEEVRTEGYLPNPHCGFVLSVAGGFNHRWSGYGIQSLTPLLFPLFEMGEVGGGRIFQSPTGIKNRPALFPAWGK
jgi:hypothetical protein